MEADKAPDSSPARLKHALREARIEAAERTAVVVDLRDAERARLELLNDALEPLFVEIPSEVDLFDRGISQGDTPRLWLDPVAHVEMGRDKRMYRFLQDTRYGRKVLAESFEIAVMAEAVTRYVARRLVERERALDEIPDPVLRGRNEFKAERRRRRWRAVRAFIVGACLGVAALLAVAGIQSMLY